MRSGGGQTKSPAVNPLGNAHSIRGGSPESPGFIQYVCHPGAISWRSATQKVSPGAIEATSLSSSTRTFGSTALAGAGARSSRAPPRIRATSAARRKSRTRIFPALSHRVLGLVLPSPATGRGAQGGAMRLKDKVAIVSGGASGMGQSEAMLFAREGAKVIVADVLETEGRQTADKITAGGGQAKFVKLDVTSEGNWQSTVEAAVSGWGKTHVLLNNAGISGTIDPDKLSTTAWDKLMDVNAKGVFLGMKTGIAAMQKTGGGSIVNISSISGFVGQNAVHMAYNASKGAVRIMTKTAAVQYAKDGIRVNSVHPGFLPPMRTSKGSADPEWRAKMLRAVPMRREGRVEEVAHAVLFLAPDDASYIPGTEIVVDGGYLAQ